MTHLLLLVGGWAGSTGVAYEPPHVGTVQAFALGLTLALMAGLWRVAERHRRELRAQRDGRLVPFADPHVKPTEVDPVLLLNMDVDQRFGSPAASLK